MPQKILCSARKEIKTKDSLGDIRNIEIRMIQNLYHFVTAFFHKILLWYQKIGYNTEHRDIGQKL